MMSQVQELIQAGIYNKMAAWCQSLNNENTNPNTQPHTSLPPIDTANFLSNTNLAKLAALLKATTEPKNPSPLKTYTGISQCLDPKGRAITYCWSHGGTRNLDHNNKLCTRTDEEHNEEATLVKNERDRGAG